MRTIKFRGKTIKGEWVYGDLIQIGGGALIYHGNKQELDAIPQEDSPCAVGFYPNEISPVIPKTVGQFTGLCDKDYNEIYEGDICTQPELNGSSKFISRCKIEYKEDSFKLSWITNSWYNDILRNHSNDLKIVGNIFDNADLVLF